MIAVSLGLLAALCWSSHDLLARHFAARIGPFRMAFWVMLAGAAVLAIPVLWRGQIMAADTGSVFMALAMGVVYAGAVAGLFTAFSLAPVSIVGPLTAGYPALVVLWGLFNGLVPTPLQWLGVALVLAGAVIVGRFGPRDGGLDAVKPGTMPLVVGSAVLACLCFAATVVMGQSATHALGEYEVTFLSRFPAALVLAPLMLREKAEASAPVRNGGLGLVAMAALDVVAVTGINASAHFPGKEFGAMAISSYGAVSVLMAMFILKEKVAAGQWLGIFMIVAGVAALGWQG